MPEISFEVYCSCGNGLCYQTKVDGTKVTVEPCEVCLKNAKDEGDSDGYERGYDQGFNDGQKP